MKTEILRLLDTSVLGNRLHVFDEAGSTNDLAKDRAKNGGEEGEVFLALKQTAGRGRLGRSWESPAGKNILLSVILRPTCTVSEASLVTLVAGAAVFDLLAFYLPKSEDLKIKWPNDVYWKDRKLAGILCETESESGCIRWVVCGIGVDLNAEVSDFSSSLGNLATSLKEALGRETDLAEAVARLLRFLEIRYQDFLKTGPSGVLDFCNVHSYLKGKPVTFDGATGRTRGTARDLSPEGYLFVETPDGERFAISAGDVTPIS